MYTKESFCNYVWAKSYDWVYQNIDKTNYKSFLIPKKGGYRTITYVEKDTQLWWIQRRLYDKILSKQELPVCAKGFVKGESYISYLSEHIGANFYLRIDIENFFQSIKEQTIRNEMKSVVPCCSKNNSDEILDLIVNIVTDEGVLPQGTCTSPMVSNIVMARVDQRITKYCQKIGVKYTRYADDLLFSSKSFNFKEKKWFNKMIKHILKSINLCINYRKTKYGEKEIILNGFAVDRNGLRLTRRRIAGIRHLLKLSANNLSILEKEGADSFLGIVNNYQKERNKTEFDNIYQLIQYLRGYRSFLIMLLYYECNNSTKQSIQKLTRKIEETLRSIFQLIVTT